MSQGLDSEFEMRSDVTMDDLLATLMRQANVLIFGRPERGADDEVGELTAFRAVVIVGGMLGLDPSGKIGARAIGVLNGDTTPHARRTWPAMAAKLREIADDLERLSKPGGSA